VVTPLTTPEEVTVAIDVLLLLQVPPEMVSVRVIVEPIVTDEEPEMVPAEGKVHEEPIFLTLLFAHIYMFPIPSNASLPKPFSLYRNGEAEITAAEASSRGKQRR
jgi:hypothetical protein